MKPYLELSMRSRGVRVVAGVGDAPVLFNDPEGQGRQARMPINWWLTHGQNMLTARVSPLAGAKAPPLLDLGVVHPDDKEPPLCRVGWGLPAGVDFEPFEIRMPFHPPKVGMSRLWTDAQPIAELTASQRAGLRDLAMSFHAAFAAKDVDAVMRLLDERLREMSLAFEMDEDKHRRNVRQDIAELVGGDEYALSPVDPGAVRITPCCGGRVFHLTHEEGPLIATLPTSKSWPTTMQVFGALIRGQWQIVRA